MLNVFDLVFDLDGSLCNNTDFRCLMLASHCSEQPDTASPPVPPRGQKKEGIYDSIPASLKSELIVKSVEQDQDLVAERQETIRTHTPAQLSEIHSLADVPIPSFIQNLTASKKNMAEPTIE